MHPLTSEEGASNFIYYSLLTSASGTKIIILMKMNRNHTNLSNDGDKNVWMVLEQIWHRQESPRSTGNLGH